MIISISSKKEINKFSKYLNYIKSKKYNPNGDFIFEINKGQVYIKISDCYLINTNFCCNIEQNIRVKITIDVNILLNIFKVNKNCCDEYTIEIDNHELVVSSGNFFKYTFKNCYSIEELKENNLPENFIESLTREEFLMKIVPNIELDCLDIFAKKWDQSIKIDKYRKHFLFICNLVNPITKISLCENKMVLFNETQNIEAIILEDGLDHY